MRNCLVISSLALKVFRTGQGSGVSCEGPRYGTKVFDIAARPCMTSSGPKAERLASTHDDSDVVGLRLPVLLLLCTAATMGSINAPVLLAAKMGTTRPRHRSKHAHWQWEIAPGLGRMPPACRESHLVSPLLAGALTFGTHLPALSRPAH